MFGYVKYDKPYLYFKDFSLYRAVYCGLCKGIKHSSGNVARFGLSYDITFLSVILHNIKNIDVKIKPQRCPEHMIMSQPMAQTDDLTDKLGGVNTALMYYKCLDNIEDDNKGKLERLAFKNGYKRVLKKYPDIVETIKKQMLLQKQCEKENVAGVDRAADATANMVAQLSDLLLEESATEHTRSLFYALGKWIYLIDAVDDYDKDIKKKNYNPFILVYKENSLADLVKNHSDDLNFIFRSIFSELMTSRKQIKFHFNCDLIDNVLFKGLPKETMRVLSGKKNKKEKGKVNE